ncbi:MAG: hypothetical protein EAZ99_09430 [Alphaproteobacteria bacterium]|nr:hypothetical protein [Alphaproteobacteria bacterium]TAD89600.1 MAG: hypothetical protein EAZ99_09430 [Alphaproteobacteria bacterium]
MMGWINSARRALAATGLIIALSGCGGSGIGGLFGGSTTDANAPACPEVGILREGQRQESFRNNTGDPADLILRVEMQGYTGECRFDRRGRAVTVDVRVSFEVTRGPANPDRQAQFTYLVAIVDSADQVIAREQFAGDVTFATNQTRIVIADELSHVIPLAADRPASSYRILAGLAVSRDEAQRNLQRR